MTTSQLHLHEVNLSAFIYRLFHEHLSSIIGIHTAGYFQPEVNLSAFIYKLFHEDLSSITRTNTVGRSQSIWFLLPAV